MSLLCASCQTQLPDNAAFCHKCGKPTGAAQKPKPRFCASCGVWLPDDALFCLACGTPVTTNTTRWSEKHDKEREEKFIDDARPFKEQGMKVFDFEEVKSTIQYRAKQLAEYQGDRMSATEWFDQLAMLHFGGNILNVDAWLETSVIPTNKPNAHDALITKTMTEWFILEAWRRGYIGYEDKLLPTVITYFELTWVKDEQPEVLADWAQDGFRLNVDFSKLDERAKIDDALFPPPQPIRVEVAGAILNFTTDEAVLIVYMDCTYKGKTVKIGTFSVSSLWFDYSYTEVEIIERTIDNIVLCAAIFSHIPFVNNDLRHKKEVHTQMDCTVRFTIPAGFENRWEETVTLFRGEVKELDWRGRKA